MLLAGIILLALIAVWFASAWAVLRVGVRRNDITADVLDGALICGPFGFAVLAWARWEMPLRRLMTRLRDEGEGR